ncbi:MULTISPECIES: hypothetical protein [unclassified Chelatococcus]|uniref:hypothetical protein n=1 Tax=unclassified Chelatococcus TaxID=2638111 RepID=UPI001BD15889|nr:MULTISPECIES: hypothetical protein [unclassified Chelatococcus]CAH1650690.1 conserved hypothetical protein [Hyphomicrobiales bacterium]MBS7739767.1 hypothetical protein [Chelatococcus sp. HY11]MBX3544136.1 hypothetical protein [Chelatococcus sp.]MCO5075697.1 hypothetical protein [Chelatococcus sp.]CAH1666058.1 conserved hypothetical protein [Hyphomicrobiales bacterium]
MSTVERLPPRLTPLASRFGLRPFYGDIHNHCDISYGHGSLPQALKRARRQLDFVSVTGHAHWPDMPVDDPRVAHIVDFHVKGFAKLDRGWLAHFDVLARADEPGIFTVFPGYEIHSFAHGDYTIVYRDLEPHPLIKADTPAELHQRLRDALGDAAFAFPHHIGYRLGARGINWASFNENLSPVLELTSMHGCSETSVMDRPFLHSMGPSDGLSTARAGLDRGLKFGFLGNTDHHSGYPGSYGHGRSIVYATENSRSALWEALHQRRTNALTGDNSHLFFAIGNIPQGGLVASPGEPTLAIEAVAGSFIDTIDVIRNGKLVARITPDLEPSAVDPGALDAGAAEIETLLVLELGWGARGEFHDWSGSIELIGGTILAVEPRLRGPEIVSPLEGSGDGMDQDQISRDDNRIDFSIRSFANPNNSTSSTQAIAARIRIGSDARFLLRLDGQDFETSATRLFAGALSGNLGPIDSPAFRLHPLPKPHQWQWRGAIPINPLNKGDWVYVRMRQANGQWNWASPIFSV